MKEQEVYCGTKVYDDNGNLIGINGGSTCDGYVYKDYDAFKSGNGICYVAEGAFDDLDEVVNDEQRYYPIELVKGNGYTRKDFLDLCGGNEFCASILFDDVEWCYAETRHGEFVESIEDVIFEEYGDEYLDKLSDKEFYETYEKICKGVNAL